MSPATLIDFAGAIRKAISEFAEATKVKSGARIAALYTVDATLVPPGPAMIHGRAGIQRFWQSFLDAGAQDAILETVKLQSSGEMAYEVGLYSAVVPNPTTGEPERSSGKYLVVWRRDADGVIRMTADMFSPNA